MCETSFALFYSLLFLLYISMVLTCMHTIDHRRTAQWVVYHTAHLGEERPGQLLGLRMFCHLIDVSCASREFDSLSQFCRSRLQ